MTPNSKQPKKKQLKEMKVHIKYTGNGTKSLEHQIEKVLKSADTKQQEETNENKRVIETGLTGS